MHKTTDKFKIIYMYKTFLYTRTPLNKTSAAAGI